MIRCFDRDKMEAVELSYCKFLVSYSYVGGMLEALFAIFIGRMNTRPVDDRAVYSFPPFN